MNIIAWVSYKRLFQLVYFLDVLVVGPFLWPVEGSGPEIGTAFLPTHNGIGVVRFPWFFPLPGATGLYPCAIVSLERPCGRFYRVGINNFCR